MNRSKDDVVRMRTITLLDNLAIALFGYSEFEGAVSRRRIRCYRYLYPFYF